MKNQSGALGSRSLAILLAAAVAIAAAAFVASRPDKEAFVKPPAEIEDFMFWEARELTDFKLIGAGNTALEPDDLKGKWSFIFFGYIHCPDVCPLTMSILGQAFKLIERDPAAYREIQGVFVSVDPQRDTPELTKEYASYFSDKIVGVTGETAQLEALSRQMSALYTIHPKDPQASGDNYQVTHNSTVFLVDPQGRLYGRFPPPQLPNEIAGVFLKIRMFYNERVKK